MRHASQPKDETKATETTHIKKNDNLNPNAILIIQYYTSRYVKSCYASSKAYKNV